MNLAAGIRLGAWAAVLGLLAGMMPNASDPTRHKPFLEDYHAFRFLLHAQGLEPLPHYGDIFDDPQHTLLIALGNTQGLEALPGGGLRGYLEKGGALLLATDLPTPPVIAELFGVEVTLPHVVDHNNPYCGNPECPLIWSFQEGFPSFRGLDGASVGRSLATNRPSSFKPAPPSRAAQLRFATTGVARYGDQVQVEHDTFALYAGRKKSYPPEQQPIFLLPDHSIFINSMLLQNDNANFLFTQNTLRWVSNQGRRRRVLFLDDGAIVKKFEVSLAEIPDPTKTPPERLPLPPVDVFNQVLASWQEDDIFNRLILERFSMGQVLSGLTLSLTTALVLYGSYRLWRGRYLPEVHP